MLADLDALDALLRRWQAAQNLVSRETLSQLWERHVVDSLQLLPLLGSATTIVDLGSGGGFPALPLAIARKGGPQRFVLIEPNSKKVSFLRAAIRQFELGAEVIGRRSAEVVPATLPPVDLVTSRALARLDVLLGMAEPFWRPGTRALFHKGGEHAEELDECSPHWQFDVLEHQSMTHADGVILEITNLRRLIN